MEDFIKELDSCLEQLKETQKSSEEVRDRLIQLNQSLKNEELLNEAKRLTVHND